MFHNNFHDKFCKLYTIIVYNLLCLDRYPKDRNPICWTKEPFSRFWDKAFS